MKPMQVKFNPNSKRHYHGNLSELATQKPSTRPMASPSATTSSSAYGGSDTIYGLAGDDIIDAGDGWDIIIGGFGADVIYGGNDTDEASYVDSHTGVFVSLLSGTGSGGTAQGDTSPRSRT